MSKPYFMIQCVLERGNTQLVTWIPEQFVVVGKYLRIKTEDGWSNGWQVKNAYPAIKKSFHEVDEMNSDYRNQRKASDV